MHLSSFFAILFIALASVHHGVDGADANKPQRILKTTARNYVGACLSDHCLGAVAAGMKDPKGVLETVTPSSVYITSGNCKLTATSFDGHTISMTSDLYNKIILSMAPPNCPLGRPTFGPNSNIPGSLNRWDGTVDGVDLNVILQGVLA